MQKYFSKIFLAFFRIPFIFLEIVFSNEKLSFLGGGGCFYFFFIIIDLFFAQSAMH